MFAFDLHLFIYFTEHPSCEKESRIWYQSVFHALPTSRVARQHSGTHGKNIPDRGNTEGYAQQNVAFRMTLTMALSMTLTFTTTFTRDIRSAQ